MGAFRNIDTLSEARAAVQGSMYAASFGNAFTDREARNTAELVGAIANEGNGMSKWDIIREANRAVGPNGIDAGHWREVRSYLGDYSYVGGHNGQKPGFHDIDTVDEARAVVQGALYVAAGDQMTDSEIGATADVVVVINRNGGVSVTDTMEECRRHTGPNQIDRGHFNRLVRELKNRGELSSWF